MNDMVAKVAKALCAADGFDWDAQADFNTSANGDEDGQAYYLSAARTAIEAMREPSGEMVDSGVAFALCVSLRTDYGWSEYVADKHRAMIDAALAGDLYTSQKRA